MLQQSSKVMINNVNKEGLFKHIDGQTAITLVDEIPQVIMFVTCFSGSASHLVGVHGARAVCVMFLEDRLYDPGYNQV